MTVFGSHVTSAPIAQGAAGTDPIVAAVAGKRIYVTGWCVSLDAAGTAKFQSAATDLTGAMKVGTTPAAVANGSAPIFATAAGEALNLTTTAGAAKGYVSYYLGE